MFGSTYATFETMLTAAALDGVEQAATCYEASEAIEAQRGYYAKELLAALLLRVEPLEGLLFAWDTVKHEDQRRALVGPLMAACRALVDDVNEVRARGMRANVFDEIDQTNLEVVSAERAGGELFVAARKLGRERWLAGERKRAPEGGIHAEA